MPRSQRVVRLVPRHQCFPVTLTLDRILRDCDDDKAEAKLIETFEHLDRLLVSIEKFHKAGAYVALPDLANVLAKRLTEIGLGDAAMMAGHIAECARRPDVIALSAVIARLERTVQFAAHSIFGEVMGPKQP